jgi:hypothetical protein
MSDKLFEFETSIIINQNSENISVVTYFNFFVISLR